MRKLVILSLVLAAVAVMTPTVANAQAYPFEASVLQVPTGNAVFQRYYTDSKTTISPGCEGACPTKPCDQLIAGQPSCQLIFNAKGLSGYRGYSEDIFNFGVGDGTVFNAVFDYEKNAGAGNHQGFYGWVRGAVTVNSTSLWNEATCTGTNGTDCLGVATASNARSEANGVPASSGGPGIPNLGGLSPIPVPKAAPGSSSRLVQPQLGGDCIGWRELPALRRLATRFGVHARRVVRTPATAGQFQFVKLAAMAPRRQSRSAEVPGTGAACHVRPEDSVPRCWRQRRCRLAYLSANGQCFLGGGLSASVYELAAKYAGKTNVEVTWKTSLEDGVRGFYVSRATTQNGPFARVSELIPAKGEASAYSFIDTIQMPAGTVKATGLWYKVETIDIDDNAVEYGPTKAQLPGPDRGAIIKQRTAKPQR